MRMKSFIDSIKVVGFAVLVFVLNVLFNVGLAAAAVGLFDWIMGTAYFSPQVVGIVALVLFAVSRLGK